MQRSSDQPGQPMDRVCDGHEPLIITRNSEQSVVMLSRDDKALEETSLPLQANQCAAM